MIMDLQIYKKEKLEKSIRSMVEYMDMAKQENFDCGYTQKDVNKCKKILKHYVNSLIALKRKADDQKIMKCVEKAVKALNKLNEKTGYGLIETDQREDLCLLIQNMAIETGLSNTEADGDITEEWREW